MTNVEEFITAYRDAMLWANTYGDDGESIDYPSGDAQDTCDDYAELLTHEAIMDMQADCILFLEYAPNDDADCYDMVQALADNRGYSFAQAGHDYALTRNHHGAGFWDRGLGELGEILTRASDSYGEASLYFDGTAIHGS